jgi:hypothetical protein
MATLFVFISWDRHLQINAYIHSSISFPTYSFLKRDLPGMTGFEPQNYLTTGQRIINTN